MQGMQEGDLWIFGYGSLMWRPGFTYEERHAAVLRGVHRSLCLFSHVHRGTPAKPGLVLGLDRGGACRGIAFRVDAALVEVTMAYLTEREQPNKTYREVMRKVRLDDGRVVSALTYVVNRQHSQYAGTLTREEILRIVRQGIGKSGANIDYVRQTAAALKALNIVDATLSYVAERS